MTTLLTIIGVYILLVLSTEVLIWRIQPDMDGGLTLTIVDPRNPAATITRHVYGHEFEGALYVSSNHWFRSWYQAALKHPNIEVSTNNTNRTYTAVPVDGEEHDRVMADYNMGFLLRFLCGFAPSKLLRLEPDEP